MATITFDVYGTLVRWSETVEDAFRTALPRANPSELKRACRVFEAESRRLQAEGAFCPFADILYDSAALAVDAAGGKSTTAVIRAIVDPLANVAPHADAPAALRELSAHHRLVPISNSDDAFLAGTLARLGDVFSDVVTAEQAHAYKPNPELFRFAQSKLGISRAEQVHIAQGMFADLAACSALGIRTIWVNRTGVSLQRGLRPLAVVDDLSGLAALVDGLLDDEHAAGAGFSEPTSADRAAEHSMPSAPDP